MFQPIRFRVWIDPIVAVLFFSLALPVSAQVMEVRQSVRHDVSPAVRDLPPADLSQVGAPEEEEPVRRIPLPPGLKPASEPDPVHQYAASVAPLELSPTLGLSFEGLGNGFPSFVIQGAPPDTNGAVGATQYVQWVNLSFAVFDKTTGNIIGTPHFGNSLWSGFGGPCQNDNNGDPVVVYDKLANRWVLSQFAVSGVGTPPFWQCVAVSTTSDATGTYDRYAFSYNNFDDYPKMGVWPDGYYVTFNMFDNTTGAFLGSDVCAYDRIAMLNHAATATQICFQQGSSIGGVLPSDVDGTTAPPIGSPNYMIFFGSSSSLQLFKFHVDFATPANSSFTGPTVIPVAPFTPLCGGGTCVPQPAPGNQLDSLADRLMYRLAYRKFSDHESLVVSHSVAVNTSGGVRWYEIQNPNGVTPFLAQQSTYAPDANFRWMGSIAMDKAGGMALGYSVSSSSIDPSIAFTGRVFTDAPNTMQAENLIITGTGTQSGNCCNPPRPLTRWGDYSAMQVDPVDDCTFWFTTEYMKTTGVFNWSTRIATFKFPNCGATPGQGFRFVPATPCRVADTRNPSGPFGGPFLPGGTTRGFTIPSSACNIPATAQAYSLNVTVVPHAALGFLTTFPCGQSQPFVSTLNSDGRTKAVAAIVPAGTNGAVCFFATDDTELVLDIDGYFVPATDPTALAFYPVTPCRLVDTRLATGPLGGPSMVGNATRTFPLRTACNLPATAQAYSLNYTSVPQGGLGFLTTWPADQSQPLVSTLNAPTGAITANAAIVPAAANGDVKVFVTNNSDLVIDINGYFAPPGPGGLSLFNLAPCRVLDTRNPPGSPPFNGAINVNVEATVCGAPATAQSYVLNATVVPPSPLGFLTLWPQGAPQPLVSTLNAIDGAVTSNMAIVPTTNGSISAFGSSPVHLVVDISGYFAP